MKVLGALVKPKGMTNHSYEPNFVLKQFSIHCLVSFLFGGNHFANQSW
jgi:hypothetical protein